MKNKSDLNLKNLTGQAKHLLQPIIQRHVFVSIVVGVGFLVYVVFLINQTLNQPSDSNYESEQMSQAISTRFDPETIERINELNSREEATDLKLPSGRINPFSE